jgi:hypothetical protein
MTASRDKPANSLNQLAKNEAIKDGTQAAESSSERDESPPRS